MKKMLLVDGNSMLFRAFYATFTARSMTTTSGIPTNAVYGFSMMLNKALQLINPDALLVAFDCGKHTFRHNLFEDYKGGRKQAPEELVIQFSLIRDYLDAMNVVRYEKEEIEADDIIGSLVKKYHDWDINVLTSDRDLLQLIDATTSVWLMKKGMTDIEKMTVEALHEKLGLTPEQICDLKGLMGDASDNIPGIPKVGEKTALKLLEEYHTLENLLDHTDQLKGKLQENVIQYQDQARLSKQLATIKVDVEIPFEVDHFLFRPNYTTLLQFYKTYEMNSLAKKLEESSNFVQDESCQREELAIEEVKACPTSFYEGTTFLVLDQDIDSVYFSQVYGLALANQGEAVYLTIQDVKKDQALLDYLASDKKKIVYDSKGLYHLANHADLVIRGIEADAMIAAFLCDSTLTSHAKIEEKFGFARTITRDVVYGKAGKMKLPQLDQQMTLCAQQLQLIEKLWQDSEAKLQEMEMNDLFYNLEMPLTWVLYKMEKEGIVVDQEKLDEIAQETLKRLDSLSKSITYHAGHEFNINSPKQLGEVLFDELQLPTSGKKRSTSADVLEKLQGFHPIIEDLLEYRKYQKMYSTYSEGLKKYVHQDGRIHTIYNQCSTQTGRLSSTEPNLQNISVRDEEAREIRKAFLPSEGRVLVSADYSQVELRVLAHMAKEHGLINAFKTHLDIHAKTAMDVFGVSEQQVDSLMRRQAKAVNFGIVYGISDFGLSQNLDITRAKAKEFIEKYLQSYPHISTYMEEIVESCRKNGYVTTMLGRRRDIPEIHDKNFMIREFGKRAAMNAPIQGTAADLIKLAMIQIDKKLQEKQMKSRMILQVHDELIFDVEVEELEEMRELIQQGMEQAMTLSVPLEAETKVGKTWYEAK